MLVKDVMLSPEHFPVLKDQTILKVCLEQMTFYSLGIATVVSDSFDLLVSLLMVILDVFS